VFFWANQCEELTAGSARGGGLEFVLTEWFYVGVLDPRLVLALSSSGTSMARGRVWCPSPILRWTSAASPRVRRW
jgi:hypothetical protein